MFESRTQAPTNGIPSLTDAEIYALYNFYLKRDPDSGELASERENALKYSAAGIERQIANRAGNVAGSGIRGDEGSAPLTVPAPALVAVLSGAAPTGAVATPLAVGPTGPVYVQQGAPALPAGSLALAPAAGGFDTTTLLIIGAMGLAVWFLVIKK